MVSARDVHDDWYEDDEPHGDGGAGSGRDPASRSLAVVGRPRLAFALVRPESFEAAQTVADSVRAGIPVLVDFDGCDPGLAGRLTDFCSGLSYAVGGTLQHIGREVLLIAPDGAEVSGDAASAVRASGFYNRR